jgi:hypothetical protein
VPFAATPPLRQCSPDCGAHVKLRRKTAIFGARMDDQRAAAADEHPLRPARPRARIPTLALLVPLLAAPAGCKTLLPSGVDHTIQPWSSYEDAYTAIDHIVPYQTTRQDLGDRKIDPRVNHSITILSYTDLLQRFNAVAAVPPEHLERGIADCLNAGKRCTAYAIEVHQTDTKRIGSFWLDLLNFRRRTLTTGWTFSGLVVFVDDVAVFALAGGQPSVRNEQVTHNPLGPIQGVGVSISPIP